MTATLNERAGAPVLGGPAAPPAVDASGGDVEAAPGRRRARRPRPPRPPSARIVRRGVLVLVGFCVGFIVWIVVLSALPHERAQVGLDRRFRAEQAQGLTPVNQPIAAGAPIARLRIPELGVDEIVVEGSRARQLAAGPGHLRTSALPGQAGSSVILGRRTGHGGPFRSIDRLDRGDTVTIRSGQGLVRYRVAEVSRLAADDASAFAAPGDNLLLVTSAPPLLAAERIVVRAEPEGEVFPSGLRDARGPVTAAELGLEGDPSAAAGLLVWSQILLISAGGAVVLRRRWERWPVWVVGAPVVAASLWAVYEHLVLLLPATL